MPPDLGEARTVAAMAHLGARALRASDTPDLDARVLLKTVLNCDDAGLIARAPDSVSPRERAGFEALLRRRQRGEPVAYITGVKEFWGLTFDVCRDVLIPRADSECLVEAVLERRERAGPWRILDLGVGSGCLLASLLSEFPDAIGVGVDLSPGAVRLAHENADRLGLSSRCRIFQSDWFASVEGAFDIIIANPPYVPETDRASLAVDVSGFEPESALFAGDDGLEAYRAILAEIRDYLAVDGLFACEYGSAEQGVALRALARGSLPGAQAQVIRDLAGRERGLCVDFRQDRD